jgi:glycosyltransferase involved in cell wall biosynthesis
MTQKGHTIIIVAPAKSPLLKKAKAYGLKTYAVEFKRLGMIKDYKFLKTLFINENPDIVNTHGNEDSQIGIFAAHKAKIRCKILSRHISAHVSKSWYNTLLYKKLANYIFTTADYTTNHLQTVFKLTEKQIFSMPSGIIPPKTLLPKEEARNKLLRKLDLNPETRLLGFVGRVSTAKGTDTIIKAFKKIALKIPDYHLVIVGDSTKEYIESLWKMAKGLQIDKKIHITGPQDNVWLYYRAFDCKILASKNKRGIPFEGVPQALLEAMYCSCPVVGAKSGGIPDIIEHDKTGLLFNSDDPENLAEMILQVLNQNDETKKRVQIAFAMVKKHHTIDAMGRNILRIYKLHQLGLGTNTFSE